MLPSARKTHVVPTHLKTPETVLSFGGLNLSARQFLLLLLGAGLSYDEWKILSALLTFPGGVFLAAVGTLFPFLLACAFAFGRIAGRDLASWGLALLRYLFRPKRLVWHSVRFLEHDSQGTEEGEGPHA